MRMLPTAVLALNSEDNTGEKRHPTMEQAIAWKAMVGDDYQSNDGTTFQR
jgi:hypothetical protein